MRAPWIGLGLLCITSLAQADAIAPPPTSCPEGSVAVDFCHGPPTCQAIQCTGDGDCAPGFVCQQRALCTADHCCSGILCGDPSATHYVHVESACSAGGTCDASFTCMQLRVCVPGSDAGRDEDAGSTSEDSGTGDLDSGARADGGRTHDAGRDAGHGPTTAGGCCAIAGARGGLWALALAVLVIGVTARRLRRPR